jgi:hypothetical protein
VVDPDHLLVSSIEPSNSGLAALETVFHEASHTEGLASARRPVASKNRSANGSDSTHWRNRLRR